MPFDWHAHEKLKPIGDLEGALASVPPPRVPNSPPFAWTVELEGWICDHLANGATLAEVLREGLRHDSQFPCRTTIETHVQNDLAFAKRYYEARDLGTHAMAEATLLIADDGTNDYVSEDGIRRLDSEHVSRSRLRIYARQWYIAKIKPRQWSDRVEDPVKASSKLEEILEVFKQGPVEVLDGN